jgi:NNP family nitrate/nitrite transporter-like MFS transporter
MFSHSVLWSAPTVNPINRKARSIPILNPLNPYGRVFFFSWWGFFIAFWSWYAFPPLLVRTIRQDLGLSQTDVANSNIAALTGTLVVRFVAGPLCDRFGPRWTYIGILLAGSVPTVLAGAVTNVSGLIALRFFVGILGGTFVPCQVWSTGFFDKNVVGTSNALIGGWGNSGGGITYFLMPLIFDSLREDRGLTPHVAWRVAFIVPFILIVATALGMALLCPDTPTGKWSERHLATRALLDAHLPASQSTAIMEKTDSSNTSPERDNYQGEKGEKSVHSNPPDTVDIGTGSVSIATDHEAPMSHQDMVNTAQREIVVAPSFKEAMHVILSLQTLFHCATYICSFGGELAINSYIASYFLKNFPYLGQTGSGRWGSMFGLLNVITRPLGGVVGDLLYNKVSNNLWLKKAWIVSVGIVSGAFLVAIGLTDPHNESMMFGLIAGMAFFLEAGNGANFALVPHVHPHANGIMSGTVGATGNLGGVIFAILFRYHHADYATSVSVDACLCCGRLLLMCFQFWIMGVIIMALNLSVCWIPPVPKGQISGR